MSPEALADSATTTAVIAKSGGGVLAPLTNTLEVLLGSFQGILDTLHVPYSYGYSIILLTLVVKAATYPLTKQQVESALAVQTLKPRIDLIKARYGEDKDKISKETSKLYEEAGVNPLAGCLPTLATIPIFIGLYSSLTNAANDGLFDTQGFYWIPSLAGPTSMALRQAGSGTSWLYPFVDGAPPIGWEQGLAYLSLPVLLVLTQYLSNALVGIKVDDNDPNANTSKALTAGLPLMLGYFSLTVPSGLALYYFSNTVLTLAIQLYLKKLGGADVKVKDLGPVTKPGSGRRSGPLASGALRWESAIAAQVAAAKAKELADDDDDEAPAALAPAAAATSALHETAVNAATVNPLVKRKKLSLALRG